MPCTEDMLKVCLFASLCNRYRTLFREAALLTTIYTVVFPSIMTLLMTAFVMSVSFSIELLLVLLLVSLRLLPLLYL